MTKDWAVAVKFMADYNSFMDSEHQEPPRPPIAPVDSEEAGCVSGVLLLVFTAVTVVMLFIWVLRKAW